MSPRRAVEELILSAIDNRQPDIGAVVASKVFYDEQMGLLRDCLDLLRKRTPECESGCMCVIHIVEHVLQRESR